MRTWFDVKLPKTDGLPILLPSFSLPTSPFPFSSSLLPIIIMRLSGPSTGGLVSLFFSYALALPSPRITARDTTSFVTSERAVALQGALNNIGPAGSEVPGAGAGFVVASPSKANPNCQHSPHVFPRMRSRMMNVPQTNDA